MGDVDTFSEWSGGFSHVHTIRIQDTQVLCNDVGFKKKKRFDWHRNENMQFDIYRHSKIIKDGHDGDDCINEEKKSSKQVFVF